MLQVLLFEIVIFIIHIWSYTSYMKFILHIWSCLYKKLSLKQAVIRVVNNRNRFKKTRFAMFKFFYRFITLKFYFSNSFSNCCHRGCHFPSYYYKVVSELYALLLTRRVHTLREMDFRGHWRFDFWYLKMMPSVPNSIS